MSTTSDGDAPTVRWVFDHVILGRRLTELCLVGALHEYHPDGSPLTKDELLTLLAAQERSEKELVAKYPKVALSLYMMLYQGDRNAARREIIYVKKMNNVPYYRELPFVPPTINEASP